MASPKRKRKIQRHTIPHMHAAQIRRFINDIPFNHPSFITSDTHFAMKSFEDGPHGGNCDKCGAFHSYDKFGFFNCKHSFCKGMVLADVETKDGCRLDKGVKGKACNVTACQRDGAWYHNIGNNKYYCEKCAREINWPGGRADTQRIFGRPLLCEFEGPNGKIFEEEIQAKKAERARDIELESRRND